MYKNHSRARTSLIFGLLLITAAIACESSDESNSKLVRASEGGTVEAVGGLVTIELPPGALAEDTEITVSKVDNDEIDTGDMTELATYEFGPDGTTFSKPVEVSLVLPISLLESGFRLVHFENAEHEDEPPPASTPLDIQDVVISEDRENVTVTTTLTSFSRLKVHRSDFFSLRLGVPKRAVQGVPFKVEAVTIRNTTEPQVVRRQVLGSGDDAIVETITIHPSNEWSLYGSYKGKVNVSPDKVLWSPPETALSNSQFTSLSEFTCTKAGSDYTISYFASIDTDEVWKIVYSPDDWIHADLDRQGYEQHVKLATGECLAPEGGEIATPMSALPTPTPGAFDRAAEILLGDPTQSPVEQTESDDRSSVSVQLQNGMTVQVDITQWGGNPNPTLKRSWAGSVELLRYTLSLTISGEVEDGTSQEVEYQVFANDPGGLIDWTDVIQDTAGAGVGLSGENVTLPWAGKYIVKGSAGGEAFELAVLAVEPDIRYGILAEPGTWEGKTSLDDDAASELADFSGEWSGWIDHAWLDEIEAAYSADVLMNESTIILERVDRFIEPLMTGVQQTSPSGTRMPYEMIVPRDMLEGTLSYKLPAFSYEDGHCGEDILTYDISGTVVYSPNLGPWSASLVLTGTLSGPLPKLTREVPKSVKITVEAPDGINRQTLRLETSGGPIIGPFDQSSQVGFIIGFSDVEMNSGSTLTDESACESYSKSIALRGAR